MTGTTSSTRPWTPSGFLDAASGLPLHPAASAALMPAYAQGWADPTRLHSPGRRSRLLLDAARASVAASLGSRPDEVVFLPSGLLAWAAVAGASTGSDPPQLVVSAVEHSTVLDAADEVSGALPVVVLPVDRVGRVDVEAALGLGHTSSARSTIVAIQYGNQEVGTCQPLDEVAQLCRDRGATLVVDVRPAAGRMPLPDTGDILIADAHQWGGPAGVGVLIVRPAARWRPVPPLVAAGRTLEHPDVAALTLAATALHEVLGAADQGRQRKLVDRIRTEVAATIDDVQVHGDPDHRLPHLVTFSVLYVPGEALVDELGRAGLSVDSGSACVAGARTPSHVLAAMGALTHGNIRVSLPYDVTDADVGLLLRELPLAVARLRSDAGASHL